MAKRELQTVGELLYWSYANLAMAHAAVAAHQAKYGTLHYMIRARLFAGLREGRMGMGSIVEDDRLKLILPQACSYCAGTESLAVDHLLARSRGGSESGDNIVWACRRCNSSKGASDVLEWLQKRGEFPALYLLRRYLKLAIEFVTLGNQLELSLAEMEGETFPFSISAIPLKYPPPSELRLWVSEIGKEC